jgi:hypothetical protein
MACYHARTDPRDVNLAKLLVRVYAHAVVVGGVHDLLREGVILLHCACFSIVMVPSRGFSYSLTPETIIEPILANDFRETRAAFSFTVLALAE